MLVSGDAYVDHPAWGIATIGRWLEAVLQSPALFLLGVNAALFIIGMFIETRAALIVLAPILAPHLQEAAR